MGGIGSGRRSQVGRDTTSDYRFLDVRRLQREGLLAPGQVFDWSWTRNGKVQAFIFVRTASDRVILTYRHRCGGNEWQPMAYAVPLDWTACNYGGSRAWFRCPADGCGRRVAKLYIGSGGMFACRHCHGLAYDCQRESDDDRAARRAGTIRRRLGWAPGILNGPGTKPKGMHWRTFERLYAEHDAFVQVSLEAMAKRLRLRERGLSSLSDNRDVGR